LLHGHSYTAHAVGCQVALQSLDEMQQMEKYGEWDWAREAALSNGTLFNDRDQGKTFDIHANGSDGLVWSVWSPDFVKWVSQQSSVVDGLWALGSVVAIHMRDADGSTAGYRSNAARRLQSALFEGNGEATEFQWNVHSRVLGNVLYIMASQKTTKSTIEKIESLVRGALTE
jgi:dethiobiotin synthetase/adenosylmethionine--8-amino-7-oxononanoate aminotransferase